MSAASPISLVSEDDEQPLISTSLSADNSNPETNTTASKIKLPSRIYTVSVTSWQGFPYYDPEERYTSVRGAYWSFEDARHVAWDSIGNNRFDRKIRERNDGCDYELDYGSDADREREGTKVKIEWMDVELPGSVPKSKRLLAYEKEQEEKKTKKSKRKASANGKSNAKTKGVAKGRVGKKGKRKQT